MAVRLRQLQTTPPVAFTNKCDLRFGGAQTVTQSGVQQLSAGVSVSMGYSPTSITFDPDTWFLKTVLTEPLAVIFLNGSLSTGLENTSYADTLVALGGSNGSYSFSLIGGTLPNGITLASTGRFSGIPTEGGEVFRLHCRAGHEQSSGHDLACVECDSGDCSAAGVDNPCQ